MSHHLHDGMGLGMEGVEPETGNNLRRAGSLMKNKRQFARAHSLIVDFFHGLHVDLLELDLGLFPGVGPRIGRSLPGDVTQMSPDGDEGRCGGKEAPEARDDGCRRSVKTNHLDSLEMC